jgi:Arc/MetJ-type ribon-helix-helix transcriptional regulator
MEKKLVPYSVYLPEEYVKQLRSLAKERKASELIRDSIVSMLDGNDKFKNGYNKGIKDAAKVVYDSPEAQMIAIRKRDLGDILAEQIEALEKK